MAREVKQKLDELAAFGGKPTFDEPRHVGYPNVGNRERLLERIDDMLDRRWFSNDGPYVREFEERIAEFVGVEHCVAMSNATVALEIAIKALELGGEVIVPSFTFVATAHALQWQKITPVFCDVGAESHHIDPAQVEALITPRTTGIIGVHTWGNACDVNALSEIARRHSISLLFDAAHAFGCTHNGQQIGRFGDAEIFSFHATKFLNSFEGGAIVTNNPDLARRARLMRNFGFAGYDRVESVGINGKMNEASAAMGLTSLESMDNFIEINRRNYQHYRQEFSVIPGLHIYQYVESEQHNYQYVVVEIDKAISNISRDRLVKLLHAENILVRRYFYPGCHQMEPYRSLFPQAGLQLTNTQELVGRVMSLPTGPSVEPADIINICQIIRFCIEHADDISARPELAA